MADPSGGGTQKNTNTSGSTSGGPFSWNGASTSSTFDPKTFGTKLFSDLNTAYGQGPKIDPISSFNPYSAQTSGLIQTGLNQVAANNSGPLSQYASGAFIGNGNPYLNDAINQTNKGVTQDVNSTFNSNGLFGSDLHANGLATGLATADNTARLGQYNTDVGNMFNAQSQLANNTNTGLAYSNLLDSKNAEKIASDQQQWNQTNDAAYNQISKYLGLLQQQGGADAPTNKPLSLLDILGGAGSLLGSIL